MAEFSKSFLEKTIQVWKQYSSAPLTLEDAREIAENLTGLFCLLDELDKKYGKEKTQS